MKGNLGSPDATITSNVAPSSLSVVASVADPLGALIADLRHGTTARYKGDGANEVAEAILQLREEITQRVPISTIDGLTDKERELAAALRAVAGELRRITKDEACDHSVGICLCPVYAMLSDADATLAKVTP